MNEYDSLRLSAALEEQGYSPTSDVSDADFILFNTCSVREKPENKLSSYIGRLKPLKDKKPYLIVGVAGCTAQQMGQALLSSNKKLVSFVMGTDAIDHFDTIIKRAESGERFCDTATDSNRSKSFSIESFNRRAQVCANVTIMKGCNNFCSYCIVPYVRGREISRTPEEILSEVKLLAAAGTKQVCLLGQNVNSYGMNLSPKIDFAELLERVHEVEGINRIIFITSHPKDLNERMVKAMANLPKVCKYLHLPLQSGSDEILKKMNRRYSYSEYLEKIALLRSYIPDIELSSDFIIGFPTETEADFMATYNALEEVKYDRIFAFNYSPRSKTKAFDMKDDISLEVKTERLNRLFALQDSIYDRLLPSFIGKTYDVLITDIREDTYSGLNIYNKKVSFSSNRQFKLGEIVNVSIDKATRNSLFGIVK